MFSAFYRYLLRLDTFEEDRLIDANAAQFAELPFDHPVGDQREMEFGRRTPSPVEFACLVQGFTHCNDFDRITAVALQEGGPRHRTDTVDDNDGVVVDGNRRKKLHGA